MKTIAFCLFSLFSFSLMAAVPTPNALNRYVSLAANATVTGAQVGKAIIPGTETVYVSMTATTPGTGSATVAIEGLIDNGNWVNLVTFTITDAAPDSRVIGNSGGPAYFQQRANITAISGAGASVTVSAGQ